MIIEKPDKNHVTAVMLLLSDVKRSLRAQGIDQWDDIYPCEADIKADMDAGCLYAGMEKGKLCAIIVLNEQQSAEYAEINWKYTVGPHMVVHRLCVRPDFQRRGIAGSILKFAERHAKECGYRSIRLDAFSQNAGACRLYERNRYERAGTVSFRKGQFYCYEKSLQDLPRSE